MGNPNDARICEATCPDCGSEVRKNQFAGSNFYKCVKCDWSEEERDE